MCPLGDNLPHDSAAGHVSGGSIYIDDIPPQRNELLVDFYYAPCSHGRVRSVDLSEASAVEGIAGLFTYRDLPGENLFGPILKDEILLVEEEIEFMGQPIVVLAGDSRKSLSAAKNAIKVDVEPLAAVLSIDEAKAKKMFIGVSRRIKRGDAESALAEAPYRLAGTFFCAGQDHFYLESQAAIAYPGEGDQLTVLSSTQNPTEVQEVIAHLLGLSMNQVVVVTKRLGGGFGGKECQATHPAAMAALVANKTGRPARFVFNKDFDMQVTGKRHPFQNDYKVGFDADGRILALEVELYSDGGAYNDLSTAVMSRAMTHVDNAYFIENISVTGTVCKTHFPPNTAFRGFGGPQGVATIENIIQEIACALGKDALEVRKINLYGKEERNVTPYGEIVFDNSLPEIFAELERTSNYAPRLAQVQEFNRRSTAKLKGIACTPVKFGISFNTKFLNQANSLVNIYLDGTVQVSTGAVEMGQGVNTNIRQLVAAEFGIDADQVIVMPTSTEKNNNTSATAASSATDLNGSAAVEACVKIRTRLAEVAAVLLSARETDTQPSPTSIVFEKGQVFDRRRPRTRMGFKELVKAAYLRRVSLGERGFYATQGLDWTWDAGPEKLCQGHPFLYYTTGAAVSEVTICRFTGELKVDRVDMLMDIGKPINPGVARGQLTGAFIQGMGWVTMEDLRYGADGVLLSHSPTTYKIPNIQDTPPIFNVAWLDRENPVNVKGSKAVGEPPLLLGVSVWAAVKHALSFVAGGEIPELRLPATNEEILTRIHQYSKPGLSRSRVRQDREYLVEADPDKDRLALS